MEEFKSGYISIDTSPRDWQIGGQGEFFSPLKSVKLISSNNWEEWLPIVEYQNNGGYDRMACVTYSLMNCFETLHKQEMGIELNFSDRYIAKLSGTSKYGNNVAKVFDTVRESGLVKETDWSDVNTEWTDYYKDIPSEIIGKGKDFISKYEVYREYVGTGKKDLIFESLNYAPLQVIVKYDAGDGLLNPVGEYNHAVTCYGAKYGEYWLIYDHYKQTKKKYAWNYEFGCILKPTFKLKDDGIMKVKNGYMYLLVEGPEQKLGMGLDGKLVVYNEKVDTILNSSSRLGNFEPAITVTLKDWNSISRVDGKGIPIK